MEEIVGARIGTTITNARADIKEAVDQGAVSEFYNRRQMQFMAAFDLGPHWEKMARGPTLFCIDDDGKPCAATNPTAKEST